MTPSSGIFIIVNNYMGTENTQSWDIQLIHGFDDVQVEYFRQLPSTWAKMKLFALPLAELTRVLSPSFLKKNIKWVRFSKEIMLLSTSRKLDLEATLAR